MHLKFLQPASTVLKSSQLGGEDEKDSVMHWTIQCDPCHTFHQAQAANVLSAPGWCPQPAVPAGNHLPFCMKAPQRGNLSLTVHLQLSSPAAHSLRPRLLAKQVLGGVESLLNLTWSRGVWRGCWSGEGPGDTSYSSTGPISLGRWGAPFQKKLKSL